MNSPKAKFLGMIWQFTESNKQEREKFKHPVAERICKSLLKLELKGNECPAEAGARIAFRKKLPNSYLVHGQDDFLNVIINVGDIPINELWPETEDTKSRTEVLEDTRIGLISIDIQILFDPLRKVSEKAIDAHWEECHRMKDRVAQLLKGVGFEAE